jgi:hypothetical protein
MREVKFSSAEQGVKVTVKEPVSKTEKRTLYEGIFATYTEATMFLRKFNLTTHKHFSIFHD